MGKLTPVSIQIFVIFLLLVGSVLQGESIWVKYGNQVFRAAGDAKAIALSEAEVASATGPLSLIWNPARLYADRERWIAFAHQERFRGAVIFDIIGFDLKERFKSKWSMVLIREGVQDIPNTTRALLKDTVSPYPLDDPDQRIVGDSVTYFNQVQWAGILGIAKSQGNWKLGVNAKILVHQLGKKKGYGIGFDVGAYTQLSDQNTLGVALRDASTSWVIWDSGTVERIAPQFLVGDVHTVAITSLNIVVKAMVTGVINLSGQTVSDDIALGSLGGQFRAGVDLTYKENLHFRLGRNPLTSYSFGLGFGFPFGNLDYALTPSPPRGGVLGTSHYVSFSLKIQFLHSLMERLSR